MKLLPVHTVSRSHDPSSPDQGSSTGVVKITAWLVLKGDLEEAQWRASHLQETETLLRIHCSFAVVIYFFLRAILEGINVM